MLSLMLVVTCLGVCNRWYPVLLDLHRFFIAISRAVVNHDGGIGTAPDPLVWSAGALPKRRRLVHAVRGPCLFYLVHLVFGILIGSIFLLLLSVLQTLHFGLIPLVFWLSGSTFLGSSLHWLAGGLDLGVGGISCVELLILYELWAGREALIRKGYCSLP